MVWLTDWPTDRYHLCGSSRHHTDIVSTEIHHSPPPEPAHRLQHVRDTIAGNSTTERPQLPAVTGIMPGQRRRLNASPSF
ncbi:hypothetical protein ACNKHN_10780 [Shigella flexneri]